MLTYLLKGQINRRKTQSVPQQATHNSSSTSAYLPHPGYPYQPGSRSYGRGRAQAFQNRSLVINNHEKSRQNFNNVSRPEQIELLSDENSTPPRRGVAKYGRGAKGWISEEALGRKLERQKHFANSTQASDQDFIAEQHMLSKTRTTSPALSYITIEDIRFQVANGGRKLLRANGEFILPLRRTRARSDLYRHLGLSKGHAKRSNSQWSDLCAIEEWEPCSCQSRTPKVCLRQEVESH